MKFATALSLFAVSSAIRIQTMELDPETGAALALHPSDLDEHAKQCIGAELARIEAEIEEAEGMTEAEAATFEQGVLGDVAAGMDETIGALVLKDLEPHASALGLSKEEEEAALQESFDRVMACIGDGDDSEESE